MSIPEPEDWPTKDDWEGDKTDKIEEAECQWLGVPQLFQDQILPCSALWNTFEHDLRSVVHGWDPWKELDDWVSIGTSVRKTPCTEIEEHSAQVSDQNGHVLVVRNRTNCETEETTRKCDGCQCGHVRQEICESLEFELKAVEGEWR